MIGAYDTSSWKTGGSSSVRYRYPADNNCKKYRKERSNESFGIVPFVNLEREERFTKKNEKSHHHSMAATSVEDRAPPRCYHSL